MKNTQDEINSRLDMAEIHIRELKDMTVETLHNETELKQLKEHSKLGKSSSGPIYVVLGDS